MRKLPARADNAVFVFFMTLLMGLTLSFVFTAQRFGLRAGFVQEWLTGFASTYVLVVPTVIVVSPMARRLTSLVVSRRPPPRAQP